MGDIVHADIDWTLVDIYLGPLVVRTLHRLHQRKYTGVSSYYVVGSADSND